jgi:hypothetical protein
VASPVPGPFATTNTAASDLGFDSTIALVPQIFASPPLKEGSKGTKNKIKRDTNLRATFPKYLIVKV